MCFQFLIKNCIFLVATQRHLLFLSGFFSFGGYLCCSWFQFGSPPAPSPGASPASASPAPGPRPAVWTGTLIFLLIFTFKPPSGPDSSLLQFLTLDNTLQSLNSRIKLSNLLFIFLKLWEFLCAKFLILSEKLLSLIKLLVFDMLWGFLKDTGAEHTEVRVLEEGSLISSHLPPVCKHLQVAIPVQACVAQLNLHWEVLLVVKVGVDVFQIHCLLSWDHVEGVCQLRVCREVSKLVFQYSIVVT